MNNVNQPWSEQKLFIKERKDDFYKTAAISVDMSG